FTGYLDLCGPQVQNPCQGSLGFPAMIPHAESEEAPINGLFLQTPIFIKASEVGYNPIPNNLPVASTVSVIGGTNKEQCIDQNASVLLGEPTIANDVFESLRYAANIDAPVAIAATSTGTFDTCMLSITNNAFTNKCCMLPDVPMEDCISQTTIMNNISHNNL
ncbi:hypothetical protein GIB67_016559, partial [Kingdonia uniflora]